MVLTLAGLSIISTTETYQIAENACLNGMLQLNFQKTQIQRVYLDYDVISEERYRSGEDCSKVNWRKRREVFSGAKVETLMRTRTHDANDLENQRREGEKCAQGCVDENAKK